MRHLIHIEGAEGAVTVEVEPKPGIALKVSAGGLVLSFELRRLDARRLGEALLEAAEGEGG